MLYPDRNIKQRKDETLKWSLDVFNEDHFSDVIKRLFDIYVRHPNKKTWEIIKQAFQDHITVISFIKNEVLNTTTYESIVQAIWNKYWEHIKKIANTEELKYYFDITRISNELLNKYKNPKELLQVLGVDVSQLTWDINVTCEEWILCFVCDDHGMSILYQVEEWEQIPNWCLTKELAKYKDKSLPIILLRKNNPDIIWTKAHEIQHHINNPLFMKDNSITDKDNIKEIVELRFKDEIIAQATHWTKVIQENWEEINEAISFYNDINNPNSYDFPFRSLCNMVVNNDRKIWKEISREDVKDIVKHQYKNDYRNLRDTILREKFDYTDRIYFARNIIKKITGGNFILALTPFDNRKDLKNIYWDEIVSE